ncbi:hypothetical protein ACVDG5_026800 [Mesorhizobium sp. ORM6]
MISKFAKSAQAGEGWRQRLESMMGSAPAVKRGPCTKTAHGCGKPPRIRPAISLHACETGGMQKRAKLRWSLPYRLRSEGWWLVDPPRAMPAAILIPFIRKRPPTIRLEAMGKIRP